MNIEKNGQINRFDRCVSAREGDKIQWEYCGMCRFSRVIVIQCEYSNICYYWDLSHSALAITADDVSARLRTFELCGIHKSFLSLASESSVFENEHKTEREQTAPLPSTIVDIPYAWYANRLHSHCAQTAHTTASCAHSEHSAVSWNWR